MAKKPFRYAVLEVVQRAMAAQKDMFYIYEYQSPIASLPTGEIINLASQFGDVLTGGRTSGIGGWALDEAWYVGCANGLGAAGARTLVELPSMTTVFPFEFIFNQIGNMRMMTGGQADMPVTIWIDGAARAGGSAQQHSQVGQEALYANVPGLIVVAPSDAYQAAGLMSTALKSPDPVIYWDYPEVESGTQPDLPDQPFDIPFGKLNVIKEGKDVTLAAWAPAIVDAKQAYDQLTKAGVSVELIDIRSIKPLDEAGLAASVKKTGRLLVVDHGYWTNGYSAHVVAVAAQRVPGAKVGRITFPDAAGPNASEMIAWMRPDAPKIVQAVQALLKV